MGLVFPFSCTCLSPKTASSPLDGNYPSKPSDEGGSSVGGQSAAPLLRDLLWLLDFDRMQLAAEPVECEEDKRSRHDASRGRGKQERHSIQGRRARANLNEVQGHR